MKLKQVVAVCALVGSLGMSAIGAGFAAADPPSPPPGPNAPGGPSQGGSGMPGMPGMPGMQHGGSNGTPPSGGSMPGMPGMQATSTGTVNRALKAGFDELARTMPGIVGVAIASADGGTQVFGEWSSGVAWSTSKVPLAVAAGTPNNADLITKAITESDNPAAEELWSRLGDDAAQLVQSVIRRAGDPTTVVESRRLRAEYTPFGQTQWALADQARFAAGLSRIPEAAAVIELMGMLSEAHRWGLAAKDYAAKGGWGPELGGGYLVRQLAVVSKTLGVALAAEVGDYDAGVDIVNRLSDWVVAEALPHQ